MGISEDYRKSSEKDEEHAAPPPPGHFLAEILQDENKFHLFGKVLENGGHHALAERIAEDRLEAGDIDLLEEQRKIFSEKMSLVEKVGKLLTKESVVELARNHPDFEKVVNLLKPEGTIRAIQSQLLEISITDESRYESIEQAIEAADSFKNGAYKEINDEVEKVCKDMNISQKEYLDALAIEDPKDKEKALKKLAKGRYGFFKTAINMISGEEGKKLRDLKYSEMSLKYSLDELNTYNNAVGSALYSSIKDNAEMRGALHEELMGDKTAVEKKVGFSDMKKEAAGVFNEKEKVKNWENYKKQAGYDNEDDFGKDIIKGMFVDEEKKKFKERNVKNTGFWHSIFAAVFERKINNMKNTLK